MSIEPEISTDSYKDLVIDGSIAIEQIQELRSIMNTTSFIFLLLGPTGAGKSTFIESLAPKGSLEISSHKLEGSTQSISVYRIKNVFSSPRTPIYLVDVPGFGDTKISELHIVTMIKEWKERSGARDLGQIFYFTPVNCIRLPGSQRRMLKTFQSLTGVDSAKNIIIISTMWDILWGESSTRRAHRNFKQLEDDIWQDYIQRGSKLFKFENTVQSALRILDYAARGVDANYFHIETTFNNAKDLREAAFGENLYEGLQGRIDTLRVQRANMQVELQEAATRGDTQLSSVVALQLEEAEKLLATFEQELQIFGLPPSLTMAPVLPSPPDVQQDLVAPDASGPDPSVAIAPSASSSSPGAGPAGLLPHSVESGEAPPSATNQPTGFDSIEHPGFDTSPTKQGAFTRALNSMICCGRGVHKNHDV